MTITMTVNGVDISAYNAKFWSITPGKRAVSNSSETVEGSAVPLLIPPVFGMREYTIMIHVYGESRERIWGNVSSILGLFTEVAEVTVGAGYGNAAVFKGINRHFKLSLSGAVHAEYGAVKSGWHTLELACLGYEYGDEMTRDTGVLELGGTVATQIMTYEAKISEMEVNYSRGIVPDTTAPVNVNVVIEQFAKFGTNLPDVYSGVGLEEKPYPISADIAISGLCRNTRGKDIGQLNISLRSSEITPGAGITYLRIDGLTGKEVYEMNVGDSLSHYWNMPAPLRIGFPEQKIKVVVTAYDAVNFPQKLRVTLVYTPVYL